MIPGNRSRGRRRERSHGVSSAASNPLPSAASSPAMSWRDVFGRMLGPLRSMLLVLTLLLVGYVTWQTASPTGDSPITHHALMAEKIHPKPASAVYSIQVVKEYPHDPGAFTQGLLYTGNDTLFESTGLYGQSSVRKVDLQTGKVKAINRMDSSFFGEGLTLLGERLFQVTWRTKTGFIYDRQSLKKLKKFTHQMDDGWGLATDGKVLFGSDGSDTLYQLDPKSFKVLKSTTVKYKGHSVLNLNELEYIDGEVWANVWLTDCIARISPQDGKVLGWIFLHDLRQSIIRSWNQEIDVLNGIAWDHEQGRLFVTGKQWPKLYEIKVKEIMQPLNGTVEEICQLRLL